jgi:hypothetical protein
MDKMDEKTPYFEFPNHSNQNNSPIGYPNMAQRNPMAAKKLDPPTRVIMYASGGIGNDNNPEREARMKWASESELKAMKLAK